MLYDIERDIAGQPADVRRENEVPEEPLQIWRGAHSATDQTRSENLEALVQPAWTRPAFLFCDHFGYVGGQSECRVSLEPMDVQRGKFPVELSFERANLITQTGLPIVGSFSEPFTYCPGHQRTR